MEIEDQQKQIGIQQQTEQSIREQAASSGQTASVVRAQNRSEAKQATRGILSGVYGRVSPQAQPVSTRTGPDGDYLVARASSQTADPDDFFSPSSPSGEPNISGSISMVSPQLNPILEASEPKPLNLTSLFTDVATHPHEELTEQVTQNLGRINTTINGGGSASSSSAAAAVDESVPMEAEKAGVKRRKNLQQS